MSKRQQKKAARRGAHDLRDKPGWDPTKINGPIPLEALRDLSQKERTESAYGDAESCADCTAARAELEDDTALCDKHLARALGQ